MRSGLVAKAPALVFTGLLAFTGYAVYFAHDQQTTQKQQMRDGVIRDIKRDRAKRREFERQRQEQQEQQQQQENITSSSSSSSS